MKETAEEKLLRAIYGSAPPIVKERCAFCSKEVDDPTYFNGEPYHSRCIGKAKR